MARVQVHLVGAGPGNAGLLTVRAVQVLEQAEYILYDKLLPPRILELAPATAERVCVADLAECHKDRHVPTVQALIAAARSGKQVVRLKGGDPFIFGRGGEEAEALLAAGIPYEIVPGVTAALGAAAYSGIPLTHRDFASAVAFITGHENPDKPDTAVDWSALARFPGTLVIYMGLGRLPIIVQALISHGKRATTPAAIVASATVGSQRIITGKLVDLPRLVQEAGIASPALAIIGEVTDLQSRLDWFAKQPLHGKRVLVTRPRHQAGDLVVRLEELGAVPVTLPAVEIRDPDDWRPVDEAITRLSTYDWLVFTSVNGVHALINRLSTVGRDLRALGGVKLAAIGPKTAEALQHYHLRADLVPSRFQSEDLAVALQQHIQPGQRMLLARADRGREILREQLSRTAHVDQVAVYSQVDAIDPSHPAFASLRHGEVDYITLTSSNIAKALFANLDDTSRGHITSGRTRLATISPITTAEVARHGLPVAVEAAEATIDGIVVALTRDALARYTEVGTQRSE